MDRINVKHLIDNFGSMRRIDVLTPGTFLRKMIIVSTLMNKEKGQTAIKQVGSLNSCSIKDFNTGFEVIKEHKTIKEALLFHNEYINKLGFCDCEEESS